MSGLDGHEIRSLPMQARERAERKGQDGRIVERFSSLLSHILAVEQFENRQQQK